MNVPAVNTPLSIIALFVALIELFLAYPVTRLQGTEQLIIVVFMTAFPFFVASAFFVILWYRPIHLYRPQDVPSALQDRYQAGAIKEAAMKAETADLKEKVRELFLRTMPPGTAVLSPAKAERLAEAAGATALTGAEETAEEEVIPIPVPPVRRGDRQDVEQLKRAIQRTRREGKQQKAKRVREEMSKFRDWLAESGFENLPPLPGIVIEPADILNAFYDPRDRTAHFGAAIADDPDTIAHTYFHVVLDGLDVLNKFEGETAALVEGLCDYYPCSYHDDPHFARVFAAVLVKQMGEKAARDAGLHPEFLRDLGRVVSVEEAGTEPHAMGLVWSSACWELRQRRGPDKVDTALRLTIPKLGAEATLIQAAQVFQYELGGVAGEEARAEVREVFLKRGIKIPAHPISGRSSKN